MREIILRRLLIGEEKMDMDEQPVDAIISKTLQKVVKGTGIVFVSSITSILLAFVTRIIIARNYTQEEYGIFSLGFTITSIFVIIGTLGLREGATRQIAYYRGKKDGEKINGIIFYSWLFSSISGIILFLLIFSFAESISKDFFHLPALSFPLKIFSFAIPFLVLLYIFTAIFRGFSSVKEKAIFMDLLKNLLFLLFVLYTVWYARSFKWVIWSFSVSAILTLIFLLLYVAVRKPFLLKISIKKLDFTGKELLLFSIPLLFVSTLYLVMNWTDTLMLGYFKTAEVVGIYNAALPLGRFISSALISMLFIYTPIVSELYAKKRTYEMRRSYIILTKWLCAVTFPLAMIFVLFPSTVLGFLFGHKYVLAQNALQILTLGFFINNLMGPNGATLTAMGETKFLMYATFAAACINVILNALLIPKYGINGAALATVSALILINIIRSIKLYSISKIHSIEKNILKPILIGIFLLFVVHTLAKRFFTVTFWMLPIIFSIFLVLYCILLLFTKSFDKEDVELLLVIEKKSKINLTMLKRMIKKFS